MTPAFREVFEYLNGRGWVPTTAVAEGTGRGYQPTLQLLKRYPDFFESRQVRNAEGRWVYEWRCAQTEE